MNFNFVALEVNLVNFVQVVVANTSIQEEKEIIKEIGVNGVIIKTNVKEV